MNNFGPPPHPQYGHLPQPGAAPPFNGAFPTVAGTNFAPQPSQFQQAQTQPVAFVGGQPAPIQVSPTPGGFNPQAMQTYGGGLNLSGFAGDPRWEKQKERKQKERTGSFFPTIDCWKLEKDQTYSIRFMNHPTHLPGGFHVYTVHLIQTQPGKDPVKVLCTESYEDVRRDYDGSLIKQPCFWCEVMAALDEDDLLDNIFRTDPSMYNAIVGVNAKDEIEYGFNAWNNRSYLFPALLKARMVKVGEYENPMPDYNAIQPCIFKVRERDGLGKTTTPLIDLIKQLAGQNQYLNDPTHGSWFNIMKVGNSYNVGGMEQASSLYHTIQNFNLIYDKYPAGLRTWGCGSGGYKKSLKQSYDYCKAMALGTWWGVKLMSQYGFDLNDFSAY